MTPTDQQLEKSLRAYADSLTEIDTEALVAGAEARARQHRRGRTTAAVSGAAAVVLMAVAGTALVRGAPHGESAVTPASTGPSDLLPIPAHVAQRAQKLKVAELGPGIRLDSMRELTLRPTSTVTVSVPSSVRGKAFTATGTCSPSDGSRYRDGDEVNGFGGPRDEIRCAAQTAPTFHKPLSNHHLTSTTLRLTNKSTRAMNVTVFYATTVPWKDFPFAQLTDKDLGGLYDQGEGRGDPQATIRSGTSPKSAREVAVRVADHPTNPVTATFWRITSKAPGRFRLVVDGEPLRCTGRVATPGWPTVQAHWLCREGLITVWAPAKGSELPLDLMAVKARPGDQVTIRVEPIDASAPWHLDVYMGPSPANPSPNAPTRGPRGS